MRNLSTRQEAGEGIGSSALRPEHTALQIQLQYSDYYDNHHYLGEVFLMGSDISALYKSMRYSKIISPAGSKDRIVMSIQMIKDYSFGTKK